VRGGQSALPNLTKRFGISLIFPYSSLNPSKIHSLNFGKRNCAPELMRGSLRGA
jgi:hypothetical protein